MRCLKVWRRTEPKRTPRVHRNARISLLEAVCQKSNCQSILTRWPDENPSSESLHRNSNDASLRFRGVFEGGCSSRSDILEEISEILDLGGRSLAPKMQMDPMIAVNIVQPAREKWFHRLEGCRAKGRARLQDQIGVGGRFIGTDESASQVNVGKFRAFDSIPQEGQEPLPSYFSNRSGGESQLQLGERGVMNTIGKKAVQVQGRQDLLECWQPVSRSFHAQISS